MSGLLLKGARRFTTQIGVTGVPDAVTTTIPLLSVTGLPTDTEIELVIDRTDSSGGLTPDKEEVVRGTVSGLNLINCIRGVEGTAQAHSAGATVNSFLTASMWNSTVDLLQSLISPSAGLINGKIVPTVASNNLTVAIKTLSGADPSQANPVYVNINGTVRAITSALSVTANAGTNWFGRGSAEFATKLAPYFVYIGYNATDGVVLGFSPIAHVNRYDGFSTTSTNERYCSISTITNASASDNYVNVGIFEATLSAGAGYTWTVPSFTTNNLMSKPTYRSGLYDFLPTVTGWSATTTNVLKYQIEYDRLIISINQIVGTSNSTAMTFTIPFTLRNVDQSNVYVPVPVYNNGATQSTMGAISLAKNSNVATCYRNFDFSTLWTNTGLKGIYSGTLSCYI